MAKLTLQDITNLQNESTVVTTLKSNNDLTEIAMEDTLSRDGQSPNQMLSNLDMNNYKIINLPDALTAQEPATYSQLNAATLAIGNGAVLNAPYVTIGNNATLVSERALTAGTNLSLTDGGANSTVTLAVSDNELNALATTTAAADKLPYFNGATTATTTDFTPYARTLVDDADATTARATLGAVIGTNVQAQDADLDALAGLSTTGLIARTGAGTAATRTLTAPAAGFTITNPAGVAGDPTFVLANDLAAVEGLSGTGLVTHTAANTMIERTLTAPAAGITITNPAGIAGNPTLVLANDLAAVEGLSTTGIVRRTATDTFTAANAVTNAELQNSTITIGSVATSLGGTLAAATGRGSTALNIDQATGHGDSIYTILATDRHVFTNAAFTAPRIWTLPAANAVNPGQRILIGDLQGTVSATNTLQIAAGGSDTINGTTAITLASASTSLEVVSDGSTKWYAVQSGSGGGGGGGSTVAKSYEFVATAAQTSFSGTDQNGLTLSYTVNNAQVYLNGLRLNKSDFTATTGSVVVLSLGANVGDLITIVDFGSSGGASSFSTYEYNATAAQTTFSGVDVNSKTLAYTAPYVMVYANGDLLQTADYTATNGTSVVLAARALNDQIKIIAMNQSSIGLIPTNNLSDVTSTTVARQSLALPAMLANYLTGLTLSTAGSSATFGIAVGVACDVTNTDFMQLASAYTKTTSAWALGTAAGSLDTGSIAASTWYHVYLIKRPDTGVVDILISLSASAPTMPTNYTLKRRIGSLKTNGSSQWFLFIQNGDEFLWDVPVNDVNTAVLGTTSTLFTISSVPLGILVEAFFNGFISTAANNSVLVQSPLTSTQAVSAVGGNLTYIEANIASSNSAGAIRVRVNSSAQIRAVATAASTSLSMATLGWIDARGKL